jgi:hypothetical protein
MFNDGEMSGPERLDDVAGRVEAKVQVDGSAEELVYMDHLVPDVE